MKTRIYDEKLEKILIYDTEKARLIAQTSTGFESSLETYDLYKTKNNRYFVEKWYSMFKSIKPLSIREAIGQYEISKEKLVNFSEVFGLEEVDA